MRLYVACGIWLLCLIGVLSLPPVREAWRSRQAVAEPEYDARLDPPKGSRVSLPATDVFGKPIATTHENGQVLLVMAGPCTDCALGAFDPRVQTRPKFDLVVVAYEGGVDPESLLKNGLPANVRVIGDNSRRLAEQLNVKWQPRWFVLDSALTLHRSQVSMHEPLPEGPGE